MSDMKLGIIGVGAVGGPPTAMAVVLRARVRELSADRQGPGARPRAVATDNALWACRPLLFRWSRIKGRRL